MPLERTAAVARIGARPEPFSSTSLRTPAMPFAVGAIGAVDAIPTP
jgi:hypothetical protein